MSKLILVGTPIGNLGDFSPRAQAALTEADFIAAEDTRVTLKLLNHFAIHKPMVSYYAHNLRQRGEEIVARIAAGETCALVTDAGMPCVSDPGEDLVRLCHERGVPVEVVPGPSAAVSALAVSGLPTGRFSFEGFLSANAAERRRQIGEIAPDRRTLIFYEAPHKLTRTLGDLAEALGPRRVAVVKELTKIHEQSYRGTLPEAAAYFAQQPPRGEYVLVVEGAPKQDGHGQIPLADAVARTLAIAAGGVPLSQAARLAAAETGHPRNTLYDAAQAARDRAAENP